MDIKLSSVFGMFLRFGKKRAMTYLEWVSTNVMKYELPCIDVGDIGPQISLEMAIPTA